MLREKTVFVVGAGASCELGLPIGQELITYIAGNLNYTNENVDYRSNRLYSTIREEYCKDTDILRTAYGACNAISMGSPHFMSIDNYISSHETDEYIVSCAKMAIVYSILQAESRSALAHPNWMEWRPIPASSFSKSWLHPFINIVSTGVKQQSIEYIFEDTSFICFNYDRCIEHCLWSSLQSMYRLSPAEAADVMDQLDIIHPYGVVGQLPWQGQAGVPIARYGDFEGADLVAISKNIRTFVEQEKNEQRTKKIASMMRKASRIVFLGFGYYEQNLELIKSDASKQNIIGTSFGLSESDRGVVDGQLAKYFNLSQRRSAGYSNNVDLPELTCADLFWKYSRTIGRV